MNIYFQQSSSIYAQIYPKKSYFGNNIYKISFKNKISLKNFYI
jgi:hypothetical protein